MMPEILPDLFTALNGQRVETAQQWSARRQEVLRSVVEIEYGNLPPVVPFAATILRIEEKQAQESGLSMIEQHHYRLELDTHPSLAFTLNLYLPEGAGPHPVILNGDACWHYMNLDIITAVLERGYILATFDRTEIVPDAPDLQRSQDLYAAFPGMDFGAISAWAWGYHRAVDFLCSLPEVDTSRIAITGHSRGGKAVLLAGATDERIALTNPNNSGCGGAGCFRIQGEKSETLTDIVTRFPFWFSHGFPAYQNREKDLPFDQHFLKAAVAPRFLLTTEALGDLWSNPRGTWFTHLAAQGVYRFLKAENNIAIWYRQGGHQHGLSDFTALVDFADFHFYGRALSEGYNVSPFG
jgi:dienelactone hydrolase